MVPWIKYVIHTLSMVPCIVYTYTMYNRLKNLVNYVLHIMVFFVHLITLDIDYVSKIRCTTYVLCTARPGDVIQFLHTNTTIYWCM